MSTDIGKLLIKGLAAAAVVFGGLASGADVTSCGNPLVRVNSDDPALSARTCKIVGSVLPMLENCQLELTRPVTIMFADRLESPDGDCFGLFHQGSQKIDILEPEAFAKAREETKSWNAIPVAEHFDAIVVHELAHALVDQMAPGERTCSADEEYIAYAMQLESLSASTRAAFLDSVGSSTPNSTEELSPLILAFSPTAFAARSWLHFTQPDNGCAFVGKVIRGDVTLWTYPE